MEKMWDSIKRGLHDGAELAVNKAEELTLLGLARLDIAAAKTRLSRLKAELGNEVYSRVQSGQIPAPEDSAVQELCDRIRACERELSEKEEEFGRIRADLEGTGSDEATEI